MNTMYHFLPTQMVAMPRILAGVAVLAICMVGSAASHPPQAGWHYRRILEYSPDQDLDLCPCTTDGMADSVNTSHVGCGQWLVSTGSRDFVCYIHNSSYCDSAVLQPSTLYPGASYRTCPESTASLPSMAQLLSETSSAMMFLGAIQTSGITRFPGPQITVFAPINTAMATIPVSQLNDASEMSVLVLQSIASGAMSEQLLAQMGAVQTAASTMYNVSQAEFTNGQPTLLIGGGAIVVGDIYASDGILHLVSAPISHAPKFVPTAAPAPESDVTSLENEVESPLQPEPETMPSSLEIPSAEELAPAEEGSEDQAQPTLEQDNDDVPDIGALLIGLEPEHEISSSSAIPAAEEDPRDLAPSIMLQPEEEEEGLGLIEPSAEEAGTYSASANPVEESRDYEEDIEPPQSDWMVPEPELEPAKDNRDAPEPDTEHSEELQEWAPNHWFAQLPEQETAGAQIPDSESPSWTGEPNPFIAPSPTIVTPIEETTTEAQSATTITSVLPTNITCPECNPGTFQPLPVSSAGSNPSVVATASPGSCDIRLNVELRGPVVSTTRVSEIEDCCAACESLKQCVVFTYCPAYTGCTTGSTVYPHQLCILKGIQYDSDGLAIWQSGPNVEWVSGVTRSAR